MDELAPPIGAMNANDPRRRALVKELWNLTRFRIWLRSKKNELLVEKADELARELAQLKVGDRQRIEIMKSILPLMPSMEER